MVVMGLLRAGQLSVHTLPSSSLLSMLWRLQKPAPRKAKARAPRKVNTANDAENEAPNSRAADVQDPENYIGAD